MNYWDHGLDLQNAYEDGFDDGIKQASPKWIPCSERLPNTAGVYITTRIMSDGLVSYNITDACYYDGSTWYDDTRINHEREYLTDVVAWMPRPTPYTESEVES